MFQLLNINDVSQSEYDYFYSIMSSEKRTRVERFRFEKDKKLTVCGELLARKMISDYCSEPPESIVFCVGENGKPYVCNLKVEFSISHSGDYVLCAVSDKKIGADIEWMRDIEDRLISFVCTERERLYVLENTSEKQKRFFEIWTAKEAYFKCIGTGIYDLKSVCVLDDSIKNNLKTFYNENYAISIFQE